MNEVDLLQALAARAGEPTPTDVSAAVLARIGERRQPWDLWPLAAMAGGSAAAACIVAAYAMRSWTVYSEPVGDLLASLSVVMQ